MASRSVKRAHNALSLKSKIDVIEAAEKGGKTKTEIANDFNIPRSTLSTILKNKNILKEAFSSAEFSRGRQRLRTAAWPKLEEALVLWLKKSRDSNLPINGLLLKEKADGLALKLGIENFKASEGWLMRFKDRHELSFRNICGEAGKVNPQDINTWKRGRLLEVIKGYHPDDIYNADETGLFYQQLPNKTLAFKGETCTGGKQSKLRITVLACANWSGTDKLKLLVIGKSAKPRCFRGLKSLPVEYKANRKAWITSEIFTSWVKSLDNKFRLQNRRVLLFIDNCSAHPEINDLTSIKLVFFPPNTTSVLRPMDQGIIQSLKATYRKNLMRRILLCYDNDKVYEMDILKAIHFIAYAWSNTKVTTIQNCFRCAGFIQDTEAVEDNVAPTECSVNDPDELVESMQEKGYPLPAGFTFKDYVSFDDNLQTSYAMTDEDILAQVLDNAEDSDDADENPTTEAPLVVPQISEVMSAIDTLQRYICMEPNTDRELKMLGQIEKLVVDSSLKKRKQMDITSYFSKV